MSGEIPKSAVARAIEEARDRALVVPAQQLPLVPIEGTDADPKAMAPGGKGGRPKGSPNKRTAAMVAYLTTRYAHPLEVLAQIYSRPVDVLAKELGCKKHEAMALQVSAAKEVAPYVSQKLPTLVDFRGEVDINEGASKSEVLAEIRRLAAETGTLLDISPNQEVSDK